jgi:hypothetical protein
MELSMGVTVRFDEAASACDPAERSSTIPTPQRAASTAEASEILIHAPSHLDSLAHRANHGGVHR